MKIAHFVITRFCIRDVRMFGRLDGPWFGAIPLTSRTVDFRLKLLETVCLPGILSQTSRDFTWILLVDRALDAGVKRRLRALGGAKVRVHLHEYPAREGASAPALERLGWLEPLMAERPDCVVTTVNDDDDALPRRFVEAARSRVLDLAQRGALPPFGILGSRHVVGWDMAFTPRARPTMHTSGLCAPGWSCSSSSRTTTATTFRSGDSCGVVGTRSICRTSPRCGPETAAFGCVLPTRIGIATGCRGFPIPRPRSRRGGGCPKAGRCARPGSCRGCASSSANRLCSILFTNAGPAPNLRNGFGGWS